MKQLFIMCLSLVSLSVPLSVHAQTSQQENAWRDACEEDALHYCWLNIPNRRKITICLIKHKSQLQPKCNVYIKDLTVDDTAPKGYRKLTSKDKNTSSHHQDNHESHDFLGFVKDKISN